MAVGTIDGYHLDIFLTDSCFSLLISPCRQKVDSIDKHDFDKGKWIYVWTERRQSEQRHGAVS
jgi:hypothetical protein